MAIYKSTSKSNQPFVFYFHLNYLFCGSGSNASTKYLSAKKYLQMKETEKYE